MNDQTPIRLSLADSAAAKQRAREADPEAWEERKRQWQAENAEAIASWNAWYREHGSHLVRYRDP